MIHIKPTGKVLVKTPAILAVFGFIMLPALTFADVQSNVKPDAITRYNFNSDTGVQLNEQGMPVHSGFRSRSIEEKANANAEIESRRESRGASAESKTKLQASGSLGAGRGIEATRQSGLLRSEDMELSAGANLQSYLDSRSAIMPR